MNCSESERLFDPYLDGELSGSLRLEFDTHRLRCPLCQQKLAMMEACVHILSSERRQPALADDFAERVMAGIEQRALSVRVARRRRQIIAATVLCNAAAAVALLLFWQSRSAPVVKPYDAKLAEIVRGGDSPALYDYVYTRVEQALAAKSNLSNDVGSIRKYALNFANLAESGSFRSLLWIFGVDEEPSAIEPADGATGAHDSISL